MKTAAALKHYKTRRRLAQAANVTRQCVHKWVKAGVITELYARRLWKKARGAIALNLKDYA